MIPIKVVTGITSEMGNRESQWSFHQQEILSSEKRSLISERIHLIRNNFSNSSNINCIFRKKFLNIEEGENTTFRNDRQESKSALYDKFFT